MNWIKNPCFLWFTLTNVIHFSKHQFHSCTFALQPQKFYKNKDIFRYNSKARKEFKRLRNYTRLVQDHHCIPREHREHELLQTIEFDINCSNNIIIMPTRKGRCLLNLHPDTLIHDGGHCKYNQFVKNHLDNICLKPEYDDRKYEFWLLFNFLKKNMQFNNDNIPWK